MTQDDFRAALADVQARQEAARLVAEYALAVDFRSSQRFMAIWHPDAIWTIGSDIVLDGLAAIQAGVEGVWATYSETHHWFANLSLTVTGDSMHGECTNDAILRETSGKTFRAAATYVDDYAKSGGTWLIYRRSTNITFLEPMA